MFDTVFDDDYEAQRQAEEEEALAPPEPTFSEADLAEARKQGFAKGHAAGKAEAEASIDQAAATALAGIERQIAQLGTAQQQALDISRHEALAAAVAIARKIAPEIVRQSAAEIVEAQITESLGELIQEPRLVIRIAGSLHEAIAPRIEELARQYGFAGQLVILADPDAAPADCRIEWPEGGVEFDTKRVEAAIDEAVARHLESTRGPQVLGPDTISDATAEIVDGPADTETTTDNALNPAPLGET